MERLKGEKEIILFAAATQLYAEPNALEKVAELAGEWFEGHLSHINL
jgi:hypothetical protein